MSAARKLGAVLLAAALVVAGACSQSQPPRQASLPPSPSQAPSVVRPAIAVTIDDLPFLGSPKPGEDRAGATQRILSALRKHSVLATGFVVCGRKDAFAQVLSLWLAASMELGNHSKSHRSSDSMEEAAWLEDVRTCSRELAQTTGRPPGWFRYPMLQTGRTVERRDSLRSAVVAMGMREAPVTIDVADWVLNRAYESALQRGDIAGQKRIAEAFVEHVIASLRHYRAVAKDRVGRESSQVLLLHATALTADHLDSLLGAIEAEGMGFVSLHEAMKDPVFTLADAYAGPIGMSWLYRIAPADEKAWAWDWGQERAMGTRFSVEGEAIEQGKRVKIGKDLSVKPIAPTATIITDEEPYPANSLVVEMADSTLVMVDTPYTPASTVRVLEWMRARFGPRRVVAINSHFHYDALGGNEALLAAGATVWGADVTVQALAQRQERMRTGMVEWLKDRPEHAKVFQELKLVGPGSVFHASEGLVLRFGSEEVRVEYPGPAHAPDNVVVYFPSSRVLFGGCMILAGDRIGNRSDADLAHWPEAVRSLQKYGAELVIPGHGDRFGPDLISHTLEVLAADSGPSK
ncbi:MAG: polysaccharide deacetylase family protein [Deltaproteobacteria bacterium]|nr:polysaccharide deacetylase family protein [Deltaproteobacteria bacterium]